MHVVIDASPSSEKLKSGVPVYTLNLLRALANLDRRNIYTIHSMRIKQEKLGTSNENFRVKMVPDILKFLPFWYFRTFWYLRT